MHFVLPKSPSSFIQIHLKSLCCTIPNVAMVCFLILLRTMYYMWLLFCMCINKVMQFTLC